MTGAVPALRRWPAVAPFGAPETVFPNLPSFDTAEALAEHIHQKSLNYATSSGDALRYVEDTFLKTAE